jgi:hypothetical protein
MCQIQVYYSQYRCNRYLRLRNNLPGNLVLLLGDCLPRSINHIFGQGNFDPLSQVINIFRDESPMLILAFHTTDRLPPNWFSIMSKRMNLLISNWVKQLTDENHTL